MNDMLRKVDLTLNIKLSDYGANIGPRVVAQQICKVALLHLDENPSGVVIFDLSNITSISTGFAFDLFGVLYRKYRDNFPQKIKFIAPSQEYSDTLRSSIQRGISGNLKDSE